MVKTYKGDESVVVQCAHNGKDGRLYMVSLRNERESTPALDANESHFVVYDRLVLHGWDRHLGYAVG